jgi:methyl coenzyme M reductase subunit C-like uncharacterized protein (methanogenesis marker protein 7)
MYEVAYRLFRELESVPPVFVEGDSIKFDIDRMESGRFYVAQLGDKPYLLRRAGKGTVDVFELAE